MQVVYQLAYCCRPNFIFIGSFGSSLSCHYHQEGWCHGSLPVLFGALSALKAQVGHTANNCNCKWFDPNQSDLVLLEKTEALWYDVWVSCKLFGIKKNKLYIINHFGKVAMWCLLSTCWQQMVFLQSDVSWVFRWGNWWWIIEIATFVGSNWDFTAALFVFSWKPCQHFRKLKHSNLLIKQTCNETCVAMLWQTCGTVGLEIVRRLFVGVEDWYVVWNWNLENLFAVGLQQFNEFCF